MALSDIHNKCIDAAKSSFAEGVQKHTSFVDDKDLGDKLPAGKIIRVTIEYVNEMEAIPQVGKKVSFVDESKTVTEK